MERARSPSGERKLTLEEYLALPDEEEHRSGLVRGELVPEPLRAPLHGRVVGRLCRRIGDHVEVHGLGEVFAESGYLLEEQPPTVRGPDVSFVSADRLPERPGTGFWPMAPDLAVEVLSSSNRAGDVQEKVGQYLNAGARLAWVVVLPGLRLPLADLFRD